MKHRHSIHPCGVVAQAARAARRKAQRRAAKWRNVWRPIALFWRQKRKGLESVRASRVALTSGAVRLAQFHLHFVIRENDHAPRHSTRGLSSAAASHQTRVVMEHRRTMIQSRMFLQPRRAQSTVQVSSLRHTQSDSGTKLQSAAPYAYSGRRSIAPATATWTASRPERPARVSSSLHTRNDSGIKVQGATQYADSSRRPLVSLAPTWAVEHARRQDPGRTQLGVRRETSTDAQAWNFEASQAPKLGALLVYSRSAAMRSAVPPRLQENTFAQHYFQPQELVWRRAVQPAGQSADNKQQHDSGPRTLREHERSISGNQATFGMPQAAGRAHTLKIDSSLMDQLADDVIRRVEKRARINRERQGR